MNRSQRIVELADHVITAKPIEFAEVCRTLFTPDAPALPKSSSPSFLNFSRLALPYDYYTEADSRTASSTSKPPAAALTCEFCLSSLESRAPVPLEINFSPRCKGCLRV